MLFPMASEENLQDKSFPLAPDMFKAYQENDRELQRLMDSAERQNSERFTVRTVEGVELTHDGNQIFVPTALRDRVLDWYHQMLVHPGKKRMEASLRGVYTWPGLRAAVKNLCKHCHTCQMFKKNG